MIALILSLLCYVGDHTKGEIEILETQVVAEDKYWIWERDSVLFPNAVKGTYNRLRWKVEGVAVLPILSDGRIVLNLNFRHATRSWEFELPRGGSGVGESLEETARRELEEETGLSVKRLECLGHIAPDTGTLSSIVPVYAGWVDKVGSSSRDESEAIAGIHAFTIEELKIGFQKGYIEVEPQGKVPLRDPFLSYALFQILTRKILWQ